MKSEKWKFIENTNNQYLISNFGNIMSLPKFHYNHIDCGKQMRPSKNNHGYLYVYIRTLQGKEKKYVHRLVAQAFIPNLENKPYINHKDCNPENNCVENLEWCTPKENVDYMISLGRNKRTRSWLKKLKDSQMKFAKPVRGTSIINGEVKVYKCINDVKKDGFRPGDVCKCCKGERKTAGKFSWEYIGD